MRAPQLLLIAVAGTVPPVALQGKVVPHRPLTDPSKSEAVPLPAVVVHAQAAELDCAVTVEGTL